MKTPLSAPLAAAFEAVAFMGQNAPTQQQPEAGAMKTYLVNDAGRAHIRAEYQERTGREIDEAGIDQIAAAIEQNQMDDDFIRRAPCYEISQHNTLSHHPEEIVLEPEHFNAQDVED